MARRDVVGKAAPSGDSELGVALRAALLRATLTLRPDCFAPFTSLTRAARKRKFRRETKPVFRLGKPKLTETFSPNVNDET